MLRTAFVDQETGQRGFVVTGDPRFLEPYDAGLDQATKLLFALDADLADDGPARAALEAVKQAAQDWTAQAAEPEIAARRAGPLPPDPGTPVTTSDKQLFDTLRNRLDALDTRTDELVTAQFQKIHSAQRTANIATAGAGAGGRDRSRRRIPDAALADPANQPPPHRDRHGRAG
jgi:CHASE3 domain sensor protein